MTAKRFVSRCRLAVFAALMIVGGAQAEDPPIVLDTYPFCSCKALVSEGGTGNPPQELIFAGAGGGLVALKSSVETTGRAFNPVLSVANNMVRTEGFVYDVKSTTHRIVIANGRGGVKGYDRNSFPTKLQEVFSVPLPGEDVRTVEYIEDATLFGGAKDIVVYGTNEFDEAGFVRIHNVTDDDPVATIDVGNGVNTIETTFEATSGVLTVLVGLHGPSKEWADESVGSLLRFDVDLDASTVTFDEPTAVWGDFANPYGVDEENYPVLYTVVRDIAIDEGPSTPRAYVAGFSRGVFAFDVESDGDLVEDTGTGWPIALTHSEQVGRANGLSLHPSLGLLAIAYGPILRAETLYWGSTSVPIAADGSEALLVEEDGSIFSCPRSTTCRVWRWPRCRRPASSRTSRRAGRRTRR